MSPHTEKLGKRGGYAGSNSHIKGGESGEWARVGGILPFTMDLSQAEG